MSEFPVAPQQPLGASESAVPRLTGSRPESRVSAAGPPPRPSRRRRWWFLGGVVVLVAGAGIAWWLWPSGTNVVPGTVQASVVSADDAGAMLGQTLQSAHSVSEPPPALPADPAGCAVAVGPATQAVYAEGWTTFGSVTYQDSDSDAEHTVTQVIGLYSTTDRAQQVFGTLSAGVKTCKVAVRAGGAPGQRASKWTYSVDNDTAATLGWKATQDAGNGWACYRQARLKGRAVLQVAVCESGDGSQAATTIADEFSSKVSG